MMTMTMIERAARAAKQALIDDPVSDAWIDVDDSHDDLCVDGKIRLIPVVRAVLLAIREPSEGMVEAGQAFIDGAKWDDAKPEASLAWQAMIDAALEEE